jgi:hypothetical protein
VNAADVLAEAEDDWIDEEADPEATDPALLYQFQVAALLAHGGQGVTIEADGELHPKDPSWTTRDENGILWRLADRNYYHDRPGPFELVPVSAEAGDPIPSVPSTWMGGGLEITYPSAEAGDTDG